MATVCQIDDPVNPTTVETPRAAAALSRAVAPQSRRQNVAVALVDRVVADRLADEMVGDREDLEVVFLQGLALAVDIAGLGERAVDLEVVAPAGDLEPVVAPVRGEPAHVVERQVGPLAGEERDGSGHELVSLLQRSRNERPAREAGHLLWA
jgi:hypothetical protein